MDEVKLVKDENKCNLSFGSWRASNFPKRTQQENLRTDKEALEEEGGLSSFSLLLIGNEWFHKVTYSHQYAASRGWSEATGLTDHALRPGRWRAKVNLLHSHINIPRHSVIVIESWQMHAELPAMPYLLPGTGLFPSKEWGTPRSCDTCWPAPSSELCQSRGIHITEGL